MRATSMICSAPRNTAGQTEKGFESWSADPRVVRVQLLAPDCVSQPPCSVDSLPTGAMSDEPGGSVGGGSVSTVRGQGVEVDLGDAQVVECVLQRLEVEEAVRLGRAVEAEPGHMHHTRARCIHKAAGQHARGHLSRTEAAQVSVWATRCEGNQVSIDMSRGMDDPG
jgi:hypothetical protein